MRRLFQWLNTVGSRRGASSVSTLPTIALAPPPPLELSLVAPPVPPLTDVDAELERLWAKFDQGPRYYWPDFFAYLAQENVNLRNNIESIKRCFEQMPPGSEFRP